MENLKISDQHQSVVKSYMKFARYQRGQSLKSIDLTFDDIINSRLVEPTYTREEVQNLLSELKELIHSENEFELISFAHTNVLLLTQLFQQAEKWHLRMTADLSEIQNKELLEHVKIIEEYETKSQPEKHKLKPLLDSSGSVELLRIEIDRLREENDRLQENSQELEKKIKLLTNEADNLKNIMEEKNEQINQLTETTNSLNLNENISEHENKSDSEELLGEYEKVLSEQLHLELESMKQEVASAQSQLELAEQELEKRFSQTAAYANMKLMISKKNEQVKELRQQLLKYQNDDKE